MSAALVDLNNKISKAASYAKDDLESITLSKLATRLQYVGTPYEKPLTKAEQDKISEFL